MSKIIYVHYKKKIVEEQIKKAELICNSLNPDNIKSLPAKIVYNENTICAISNPTFSFESKGVNVLFGQAFGEKEGWDEVESFVPDGNYIIFRNNKSKIEILSDVLATRALWYYHDSDIFVASTSQRAVIQYIGNFSFNKNIIPWMLANGMLGPGQSWDKRISLLPPDSSLLLDSRRWTLELRTREIEFKTKEVSDREHVKKLQTVLESTFTEIKLDYSQWQLSLSGGYDSRGNVLLMPKKDHKENILRTITWGLKKNENTKRGDAQIARKIANNLNLPNVYFYTDSNDDENNSMRLILERFLKNGEGRIDHVGGYTDGFKIWKDLFESDIRGIIRGDEVFGSYYFASDFHLKKFFGLSLYSDYGNLKKNPFLQSFNQEIPGDLIRKEEESVEKWRDRLYQSFLVPNFLSALSDLKQPYVEQINPLLSKKIVMQIREMPDRLRSEKKAFKKIVEKLSPDITFANSSSIITKKSFLEQKAVHDVIFDELDSSFAKSIFPSEFLSEISRSLVTDDREANWHQNLIINIKAIIPKNIKKMFVKKTFIPIMDNKIIAFRLYMILKMIKIFKKDIDIVRTREREAREKIQSEY